MARVIKQMTIRLQGGASAVLSTAEIALGEYETMLASADFGTEYAVKRSGSEAQAMADFKHLRKCYHVPELSGKYADLSRALKIAAEAGAAAARLSDDGGTCNFDSASLYLKGWNGRKVEQAAREAAEAMSASLKASGYHSGVYYQMD